MVSMLHNALFIRSLVFGLPHITCSIFIILEGSRASMGLCVDVGSRENNIIQIDLPDGSTNLPLVC